MSVFDCHCVIVVLLASSSYDAVMKQSKIVLSDRTRIGKKSWAELKELAMLPDYDEASWFVSAI